MKRKKSVSGSQLVLINKNKKRKMEAKKDPLIFANKYFDKFPKKLPKFLSWDINANPTASVPLLYLLNNTVTGSTNQTRLGNEIMLNSIQYKTICKENSAPNNGAKCQELCTFCISIIYDKAPQGALPAVNGTSTSIFNGALPHDLPNFDMSDRYTIILNELFTAEAVSYFQYNTVGTTQYNCISWRKNIEKFRKMKLRTKYNINTNNDITDFNIGALYLVLRTDGAISGLTYDNTPLIDIDLRVRFEDA